MKYQELSQEAKFKAQSLLNADWSGEFEIEYWEEKLAKLGFYSAEIDYRGFWSQGDGASFTSRFDIETWLKHNKLAGKNRSLLFHADDFDCKVYRHNAHYVHENSTSFTWEYFGESSKAENQLMMLETQIKADMIDLNKQIYRTLESGYDAVLTDDAMIEMCESNDYNFNECGEIVS